MRVMHYQVPGDDRLHAEPLCGDWGGMDSGWTETVDGVTCASCLRLLGRTRSRTVTAEQERAVVARRDVDGW